MKFSKQWLVVLIASLASVSLVVGAVAQQSEADELSQAELSVAIHPGTCDDLDADPVFQLGTVSSAQELADTAEAEVELMGFQDVEEVLLIQTNLEGGITSLFDDEQVLSIVVRDSQADDESVLVCGELGGFMVNGQIAVGLTEPDDEALDDEDGGVDEYFGVAIFGAGPADQGDTATLTPVRVYIFTSIEDEVATPIATVVQETVADPPVQAPADPVVDPPAAPPASPTGEPTAEPTDEPTVEPTDEPTVEPTENPTEEPTSEPTVAPTTAPTEDPTAEPTEDD